MVAQMPSATEMMLIDRIDTLVERGRKIQQEGVTETSTNVDWITDEIQTYSQTRYPEQDCRVWHGNFIVLVEAIIPKDSELWRRAEKIIKHGPRVPLIDEGIDFLSALKENLVLGLLRRTEQRIESAVTVDYLDIAERLFTEVGPDTHRHLAAAVIAGAVFEHGLRTIAQRNNLQITADDGKPLMLNGLIEALKKAGVVTELHAKSMRAWAGIRNAAAHGQFSEVSEAKARELISGVTAFLTTHQ